MTWKAGKTSKELTHKELHNTRDMRRSLTLVICALLIAVTGAAQTKRMAVVETSTCYMRIAPDYESALETQELMGTVVEIVGESGYWREIVSPQPYKAWTTEKTLVEMSAEQIREYEAAPKYMFTELYGHIYLEPSEKSQTLCDLVGGDVMRAAMKPTPQKSDRDNESSIGKGIISESKTNAISKGKWAQVVLPSGTKGWVLKSAVQPLGGRINIRKGDTSDQLVSDEKMEAIIASAEQLLGVPYLWGGMSSKGVDCSGLVRISAIMNGVLLPRNASQQIFCGEPVEMTCDPTFWDENSRIIKVLDDKTEKLEFKLDFIEEIKERVKNLKRGDLVFFGTPATADKPRRVTHVGIYLGNNRIIHSSHKVRINSLIPGDADYYENAHRLIAAVRL